MSLFFYICTDYSDCFHDIRFQIFSESHLLFARLFYFPTFFTVNIRCRWYSMHTVSRHGTAHLFHAPDPLLSIAQSLIVRINPIFYLMETVRRPLFGLTITFDLWNGALLCTAISILTSAFLFLKYRARITYWL